ncbi:MAG TPA: PDZ domain-containing protein [Planctomycetota bacterium]|nr:PDZ domain-containing protein [Planctomycetota bacterium]
MEISHRPGNLTCSETRELLSDLLDARRGELPHPDGSRLAESGVRPAVELHLAGCASCREELHELEQIGVAFASYSVNEAPAQMFEDYGRRVRERMRNGGKRVDARSRFFTRAQKYWLAGALSTAAAAAWAIVISTGALQVDPRPSESMRGIREELAQNGTAKGNELARLPRLPMRPLEYIDPSNEGRSFQVSAQNPADLQQIQQHEGRSGYLLFPEPLLGVRLKTTRDTDRVADEGPGGLMVDRVIPGSPAWQMGVRKNDHIVTVNGDAVKDGGAMEAVRFLLSVRELGAGKPVELHIVRPVNGQYLFLRPVSGVLGQYEFAQ